MSIKTSQRKHTLGELQRRIDQLEQEKSEEDDNSQGFSEHENSEGFLIEFVSVPVVRFSPRNVHLLFDVQLPVGHSAL